jgi:hypothetical protein
MICKQLNNGKPKSSGLRLLTLLIVFGSFCLQAVALPTGLVGYDPSGQIRFNTPAGADTKRQELIEWIWPGGLPTSTLPAVTTNISLSVFSGDLTGIDGSLAASVDRLVADIAPYDFQSIMYLIHPVAMTSHARRLFIAHSGHRRSISEWYGVNDAINAVLAQGFTVLVMDMPMFGWNTDNTVVLPDGGGTVTIPMPPACSHCEMETRLIPPLDGGTVFRFFLEPVVQGINYFLATTSNPGDISMTGHSGGGWSTHMAAAIDTRIKQSFPACGSYPMYLRNRGEPDPNPSAEFEQGYYPLYGEVDTDADNYTDTAVGVASWLEIYALAGYGSGRSQVQLLNYYDGEFGSDLSNTYKDFVSGVVDTLGQGDWDLFLDTGPTGHWLSQPMLNLIILPRLGVETMPGPIAADAFVPVTEGTRHIDHTIDSSGLRGGVGNDWLLDAQAPAHALPAPGYNNFWQAIYTVPPQNDAQTRENHWAVWDLGSSYTLEGMRVWNQNTQNWVPAPSQTLTVDVLVSSLAAPGNPNDNPGNWTRIADNLNIQAAGDIGVYKDLGMVENVRWVAFNDFVCSVSGTKGPPANPSWYTNAWDTHFVQLQEIRFFYEPQTVLCDPPLLADTNDDCVVDMTDLIQMAAEWL